MLGFTLCYTTQFPGCREGIASGLVSQVRKCLEAPGRGQTPVRSHDSLSSQHLAWLQGSLWADVKHS